MSTAVVAGRVTIRSLRADAPQRFYPQTWFARERFAQHPLRVPLPDLPVAVAPCAVNPDPSQALPRAVQLVDLYLRYPDAECWQGYLWTCDVDRFGQRVYVGGLAQGDGFQIHRHLHLNEQWGIPVWR